MTTLTWIYVVAGFVMAAIALTAFLGIRKMRSKLTRQSLFVFVGQFVMGTIFGGFFFHGVLSVIYFATVAVIYIPTIVWILRLPKDDHVA
ncbi:MAG: hypothetical protein ACREFE_17050 [Limisphaerales bacterium]